MTGVILAIGVQERVEDEIGEDLRQGTGIAINDDVLGTIDLDLVTRLAQPRAQAEKNFIDVAP